jgi:hypothetical protein
MTSSPGRRVGSGGLGWLVLGARVIAGSVGRPFSRSVVDRLGLVFMRSACLTSRGAHQKQIHLTSGPATGPSCRNERGDPPTSLAQVRAKQRSPSCGVLPPRAARGMGQALHVSAASLRRPRRRVHRFGACGWLAAVWLNELPVLIIAPAVITTLRRHTDGAISSRPYPWGQLRPSQPVPPIELDADHYVPYQRAAAGSALTSGSLRTHRNGSTGVRCHSDWPQCRCPRSACHTQ